MIDKMREEFEVWAVNYGVDDYESAWQAWQASRAALCVELPKQWFDDDLECDLMVANRVLDALDAAGVRYK